MTKTNVTLAKVWLTFDDFVYVVWPFYVLAPKDLVSCMLVCLTNSYQIHNILFGKINCPINEARFVYNILQIDTGKEHTE